MQDSRCPKSSTPPLKKGDIVGKITVISSEGKEVGTANIVALNDIGAANFGDCLIKVLKNWYCGKKK